jgi:hypothetical protein
LSAKPTFASIAAARRLISYAVGTRRPICDDHAVGRANFLDDPSQVPHCKPKTIYEFFDIAESTGQNKSKQIRDALGMEVMSPDWTLPSRLAGNPMVWMVQINGLVIDIRRSSPELQRLAYEKGLILFIPADRGSRDP